MKKELRYYQKESISAAIADLKAGEVPYLSIPTGAGKSLILAELSRKAVSQGGRCLQIVPRRELCAQNHKELIEYDPDLNVGICSAGMTLWQPKRDVVIATIGSIAKKVESLGKINLVLIDEAHLVAPNEETMYRKVITQLQQINPRVKIVGVTATPYRMGQGYIHMPCIKGTNLFTKMAYEANISTLIKEGYLSHVESISGDISADLDGVSITNNDYNTAQMGVKFDAILYDAIKDMYVKFYNYGIKTALIFASNIENAEKIVEIWNEVAGNDNIKIIHGKMSKKERDYIITWFKTEEGNRYLVNVDILTTGFDHAKLDCVVFMRATKSLGLYVQICGRVIRAHSDKEVGYILDYGTNIERHGPIDNTRPPIPKGGGTMPKKLCKLCEEPNRISAKVCSKCGAEFISTNEEGDYSMRSRAQVLQAKLEEKRITYQVSSVAYDIIYSRADATPMIRQSFLGEEYETLHSNLLCLNHHGYALHKAKEHLMSMLKEPEYYIDIEKEEGGASVENVLKLLQHEGSDKIFKKVVQITIEPNEKNTRFKNLYELVYEPN